MKKILGILCVFILTLSFGITAFAEDGVTVNTTSNTTITYSGTIDGDKVFAVLVQAVDENGNTAVVGSATVTNNHFSGTISGLSAGKNYTLKVANYDGGSWIEQSFVMPNKAPSSGSSSSGSNSSSGKTDEADTSTTKTTSPKPTVAVKKDDTNKVNTEKNVTTTTNAETKDKQKEADKTKTDSETLVKNISVDTLTDKSAPETVMNTSKEELFEAPNILTEKEKERIKKGEEVKIWLEVKETTDISDEDKAKIEEKLEQEIGNEIQPFYLDLTLWKQVGDDSGLKISEPGTKISVSITIPESLRNTDVTKTREYSIIRLHDGVVEVIKGVLDENWNFVLYKCR